MKHFWIKSIPELVVYICRTKAVGEVVLYLKLVTKAIINHFSSERAVPTGLIVYIARFTYQNNCQKCVWRLFDSIYISGSWAQFIQLVIEHFLKRVQLLGWRVLLWDVVVYVVNVLHK